jgi:hypothetical protein
MVSVTQRIKEIKQPRGGYINPKTFVMRTLEDGSTLHADENIHSGIVGLTVDYLTRYSLGALPEEAFRISLMGAIIAGEDLYAKKLLNDVSGLDDLSISNACKLSGFDVCFRAGMMGYKPVDEINPDKTTIENIRTMVERSIRFMDEYGPLTKDGFTFPGAYTELISTGDGDFLTKDTLWDFKVSIKDPTNAHTLQLLIYYLMGKRTNLKEFQTIERLGIYNPRLNKVYVLDTKNIPHEILDEVSTVVIGYI